MTVTVGVRLSVDNNESQVRQLFSVSSLQSPQNIQRLDSAIMNVSTNVQTVPLTNVSGNAGYAYFRNVSIDTIEDGTAFTNNAAVIALGAWDGTSLNPFVALKAGEPAVLPLSKTVQLAIQLQTVFLAETSEFFNHRLHYAVNGR